MTLTLALILIIGLDLAVLALVMLTVHLPFRLRDAAEPQAAAAHHAATTPTRRIRRVRPARARVGAYREPIGAGAD
jgi:hypothetical protein